MFLGRKFNDDVVTQLDFSSAILCYLSSHWRIHLSGNRVGVKRSNFRRSKQEVERIAKFSGDQKSYFEKLRSKRP